MNKILNLATACAALAAAFLANAQDWSSMSGSVTVPEGETWTATESDMSAVNALSSITVDGELVFSSCTTCPKADLLLGQGTVRKTGTETWNLAVDQTDFDGNFRIGGGKVVVTTAYPFGKTASGCNGAVYVESGATLKIASRTVKFVWRPIHIAGPGYGVAAEDKALCIDTAMSGAIGLLYLDDDATLYVRDNENHYFVASAYIGQPLGDNTHSSVVDLGNHTLTKTGAMDWYFLGPSYLGGTIVNAEGQICLRESTKLGAETDGPFIVQNATTFRFYNNPPVVRRPMRVDNVLTVSYDCNSTDDSSLPLLRTNCCNWAGAVTLNGETANLIITPPRECVSNAKSKSHDIQLSFFGDISGAGKLTAGRSDRTGVGRSVLGGHNSYSGATYVYGGVSSRLYAYWHDSIPDYSKLTVDRGYVAVRPGTALAADGITLAERWPLAKIFDLRREATFLEDGATAIDATDCPDGLYSIAASDLLANDARHDVGFGSAGGVVRITSNPGDVLPITPCAYRGELELTGGGTYQMVGSNVITSVAGVHSNGPCVTVKGGAKVLQGLAPFYVGCRYKHANSSDFESFATVAISNATWETTCAANPGAQSASGFSRGALYVGSHARGVLDLQKGAVVSNKLMVGGGYYLNWQSNANSYGEGAVYVGDGAKLYVTSGGAAAHYASSIGMGGYGYLELAPGGAITTEGNFHIGGYKFGVYHQYGGTFKYTGTYLCFAKMGGGSANVYLAGGTLSAPHFRMCNGSGTKLVFTVEGTGTVAQTETIQMNEIADAVSVINVNDGGTLDFYQISPYDTAPSVAHPIVLNIDGGRLKKNSYSNSFLAKNPTRVEFAVYGKGMTIDTSRYGATQLSTTPYVGHVSGGVQSVDATAALGEEWIGAPKVLISGDGCGASAVADWDRTTRKLRGIKITSHGWGYTQGKVTVKVQTVDTTARTVSISGSKVTVGDNDIGGFTLVGSNTFTLYATNSWQKWTRVDGGTLKVASNGAIPANTELVMNGGTLNLNGFDADAERPTTFSGLSGTGGTIANGSAKVVGEWRISASNILTQTTTALTGALDLSGVTKIVIADADALADAEASHILGGRLFTATSVVWPQDLVVEGAPSSWQATKLPDGNGLRLRHVRGLTMIFR